MENAKCYAPQILVGTEGLPREQWLEYRRKGIGGSDAAAVLGISPFRTGRDLYYDKLNITALPAIRTAPLISSPRCFFPLCLSAWFAMRTNIVPAGSFRFLFMYLVKSCVPVE